MKLGIASIGKSCPNSKCSETDLLLLLTRWSGHGVTRSWTLHSGEDREEGADSGSSAFIRGVRRGGCELVVEVTDRSARSLQTWGSLIRR